MTVALVLILVTSILGAYSAVMFLVRYKCDYGKGLRKCNKLLMNFLVFVGLASLVIVWLVYALHNSLIVMVADMCFAFRASLVPGAPTSPGAAKLLPCLPASMFTDLLSLCDQGASGVIQLLNAYTQNAYPPGKTYSLTDYTKGTTDYPNEATVATFVASVNDFLLSKTGWQSFANCDLLKKAYKTIFDVFCTDFIIQLEQVVAGLMLTGIGLSVTMFSAWVAASRFDQTKFPHEEGYEQAPKDPEVPK